MSYRSKNNKWVAQWYENGKRKTKGGFSKKKFAKDYEEQQKKRIEQEILGNYNDKHADIEMVFDHFLKWTFSNNKQSSAKRDESNLRIWHTFFINSHIFSTEQMTDNTARDFVEWRSNRRTPKGNFPAKRTINLDLITIRHVFSIAVKDKLISKNPMSEIPLFNEKKTEAPSYLTEKEIAIIEDRAKKSNIELWQAITVLVRTGLRSGELCSLQLANIDFDKCIITLKVGQTKASRARMIPFAKEQTVIEIFHSLAKEVMETKRTYLFRTRAGSQQTQRNLNRRFRYLLNKLEKEGVLSNTKPIHIHSLRATYISHLIMKGEDPVKVMAIVGHQDWSTMKRYLALSPSYLDIEKLPY